MDNITLFTTCKPFIELAAIHQRNAITSWTLLRPRPEVVIFGDEEGVYEEARKQYLCHFGYVRRDEWGLPYLDFIFERAQVLAFNDLLAYVNADNIILGGLTETATRCAKAFPDGFLGVCRRWDVELDEHLDFKVGWQDEVLSLESELYSPCSSDMFIFKRPLPWEMLPFVGARGKWDNHMLYKAVETKTPVVDVTDSVVLIHPKHKGSGVERKALDKDESGQNNARLAGNNLFCLKHVQAAGMLWKMTPYELEKV